MRSALAWFNAWWDATDRTKDVKLAAFGAVVVFAVAKLASCHIDSNWVDAFYGLCAMVGLGGPAWAVVENWRGPKCSISPNPGPSASAEAIVSASPDPSSTKGDA